MKTKKKDLSPARRSAGPPIQTLIGCGRQFYERRWMWGTAGNLSLRLKSDPLEFAITPSGVNKGYLDGRNLITIKDGMSPHPLPPVRGRGQGRPKRESRVRPLIPSAETVIHQAVYRAAPDAGAVFHVHPIYSTLISSLYGDPHKKRILKVNWFEMMKGVGVGKEESSEVTILPNWQDVSRIAQDVTDYLKTTAKPLPVVLIYNHGLTGWGSTPDQARNHLEIIEFVCQYLYLKRLLPRAKG